MEDCPKFEHDVRIPFRYICDIKIRVINMSKYILVNKQIEGPFISRPKLATKSILDGNSNTFTRVKEIIGKWCHKERY